MKTSHENDNHPIITSVKLSEITGIRHGFFGSKGGVSENIYHSLNCGPGSNDSKENVEENRAIAVQMLGGKPENLYTLYQCHSDKVITIEDTVTGGIEADALVTRTPGLVLGILTADCVPVLFADPKAKVIGAAHAGWKGAFTGILEHTTEAMESLGAKKSNIIAAIGPCIRQKSYEVGPEFLERFLDADTKNKAFFVPSKKTKGHWMFDLAGYVYKRLELAGIKHIDDTECDTCAEDQRFFSFRRNTLRGIKDYGRQLSAITIE